MSMERIAFIGTGVMGRSMVHHLLAAGHDVIVYNRTKEKTAALLKEGARWADSPGEAAALAEVVITIVGYPTDVEAVYLGKGGILERAPKGALLIDMTTSSPALAIRIATAAGKKDLRALDAPVSGGDLGARNGTLSIMVGGSKEAFTAALPILSRLGKNIVLQGGSGAGQHCKLCNQIAIASNMMGVVEALHYGVAAGLDARTMLKSIESGAAGSWSLSNLVPRMIDANFAPGFYVKHFIKDMRIALDSAQELGLHLPGLDLAAKLYRSLAELSQAELEAMSARFHRASHDGAVADALFGAEVTGGAELGTQALYLLYLAGRA